MTKKQGARTNERSATTTEAAAPNREVKVSLDAWAVALALITSLLVWTGVIKHIPW
jgi:hypothetical protein